MSKKGPRLRGGNHKGSDRSKHTRSPGYQPGDNWLVCDVCGCHVYSSDAMQRWDGMVTCKQDWEPRHEQDFVRARKDRLIPQGLLRPEGEDHYLPVVVDSPVPAFSTVPNFYSVVNIGGGNVVPPPATRPPTTALSTEEPSGVDMNEYLLNGPVHVGSWEATGSSYISIDPVAGILTGSPDAPVGRYFITVSARNRGGVGYTNEFDWEVLPFEGYQLDFDKAAIYPDIGNMTHTRNGGDQTYLNHLAAPTLATGDEPALSGQDGPAYSIESNVGYGLDMTTTPLTRLIAPLEEVEGLPDNGMEMEASGHVVFRIPEGSLPWPNQDWLRVFSLRNAGLDPVPDDPYGRTDRSNISLFTGPGATGLTLAYRTRNNNLTDPGVANNGFRHLESSLLPIVEGSIVDVRFKLNKEEGAKFWIHVDGVLVEDGTVDTGYPADPQIVAIDTLGISGEPFNTLYEMDITMIHFHLVASGYVEDADILAWPQWEHPIPIILGQPVSASIAQGGDATFTVAVQHPYPSYEWQIDTGSGWQPAGSTSNTLSLTNFTTVGVHPIQCVITNPASASVTTVAGVTLTVT